VVSLWLPLQLYVLYMFTLTLARSPALRAKGRKLRHLVRSGQAAVGP
jgi:hypothetical protein